MVSRRSTDGLVRALLGAPTLPWHTTVPDRLEVLLTALPAPARAGVRAAAGPWTRTDRTARAPPRPPDRHPT